MTKEQNVVAFFYLCVASSSAGIFFHRASALTFVFFLLAFILKVVNSLHVTSHEHGAIPLTAEHRKRSNDNNTNN
jgi:hypothetical protein